MLNGVGQRLAYPNHDPVRERLIEVELREPSAQPFADRNHLEGVGRQNGRKRGVGGARRSHGENRYVVGVAARWSLAVQQRRTHGIDWKVGARRRCGGQPFQTEVSDSPYRSINPSVYRISRSPWVSSPDSGSWSADTSIAASGGRRPPRRNLVVPSG